MSQTVSVEQQFSFPGRWVGGICLVLAPVLLLAGSLLRIQFDFFFTDQLEAFRNKPQLLSVSYSLFLAGNLLLWPAILTITKIIGVRKPGWALWAGTFVMFGLFARTFHAGIDHLALQLVRTLGVDQATDVISRSYGAYHIVSALNAAIFFGWILLGLGAFLTKTLGLFRSLCLASTSMLMMGVLKGTSPTSIIALTGLLIAFVPLGVKVLATGNRPSARSIVIWTIAIVSLLMVMAYTGQLG